MTGSAITIVSGQVRPFPLSFLHTILTLLFRYLVYWVSPGSSEFLIVNFPRLLLTCLHLSTRAACYKVIINTLKGLPRTKLDAAFGITCLFFLYAIRISCDAAGKRYPKYCQYPSPASPSINHLIYPSSPRLFLHLGFKECIRHGRHHLFCVALLPPQGRRQRQIPYQNFGHRSQGIQARQGPRYRPCSSLCPRLSTPRCHHHSAARAHRHLKMYVPVPFLILDSTDPTFSIHQRLDA